MTAVLPLAPVTAHYNYIVRCVTQEMAFLLVEVKWMPRHDQASIGA